MIDSYKYTFHHENEIALLEQDVIKRQRWGFYRQVNHQKKGRATAVHISKAGSAAEPPLQKNRSGLFFT